jgi:hypothetical protein
MVDDYPIFMPPGHLAEKDRQEWRKSEADEYFQWFQENIGPRVKQLLEYLNEKISNSPDEKDLARIGKKIAMLLQHPKFSIEGDLTDSGYALAADMGLLMSVMFQSMFPHLHWQIVRRPKSDISYNLPVLTGFGPVDLDPIQISITQAFGTISKNSGPEAWSEAFKVWKGFAKDVVQSQD